MPNPIHQHSTTRTSLVLVAALALALLAPTHALGIAREDILTRAEVWVERNVPYSQSRYAAVDGTLIPTSATSPSMLGYRTDCSGFVSMAFGLESSYGYPLSLDTASLPYRCTEITGTTSQKKAALKPGDIMLKPKTSTYGGHTVIFVRWADATKTRYVGYHERGTGYGAVAQEIPYPYWNNDTRFRPFRYSKVEDAKLRRSRLWFSPLSAASAASSLVPTTSLLPQTPTADSSLTTGP